MFLKLPAKCTFVLKNRLGCSIFNKTKSGRQSGDAANIVQFKAGWDVTIAIEAADVDGDGQVTVRDAARILQYKAGWDVVLGK